MMMKFIFILSTIYILIKLLSYFILGKENDIARILNEFNALNKNKKIIFITSFFIFSPFYTVSYFFRIFYMGQISLVIFICLPLKVKIERKKKNWNSCNYSYSNLKINQLNRIIFTDGIINSYNTAFDGIYKMFSIKNKKNYKNILDHFAFIRSTGISLNYLDFILNFTKKYKNEKIKKKIKLRIIIRFKRILNAIIMTINVNFREESLECSMRIIIKDFKVLINGNEKQCIQTIINTKGIIWKISGTYIDKNNPKLTPHIFAVKNNDNVGFTSTPQVRIWGTSDSVKSHPCGLQPSGRVQYCVPFIKGQGFENRFKITEDLSNKIVRDFDIGYRQKFIGFELQKSIFISSHDMTEGIMKGEKITKSNIEMKKSLKLDEEQMQVLKNISHEEMGELANKSLNDQDLFNAQRGFYDKVMKPQSKDNYYDL